MADIDAEIAAEEERKRKSPAGTPPPEIRRENLAALIPDLKAKVLADKPAAAQLLREDNFDVEGVKWIIRVPNPFCRQQLLNERETIINFVRKALNHPSLTMDVVVVETPATDTQERPLTEEEKRRRFHELNPAMRLLEETFDTFVDYSD
ncbi:MAG: hypothetical protein NZ534_10465 [Bacteroidia bacterium]|nr:hypothetical protein [Bacteroidia bacterium]